MKPQTAAACAVHYAHEESKRLFAEANSGGEVPALSLDALALQVRQPASKQTHWLSCVVASQAPRPRLSLCQTLRLAVSTHRHHLALAPSNTKGRA
eukprot:scaffold567_cov127-Isochrysis_galbana.AAC.3